MKVYEGIFQKIISLDNMFLAWQKFRRGKSRRRDVRFFERRPKDNIYKLHQELKNFSYRHRPYISFYIQDPKQRHIHKAHVRDRIIHQAVFNIINPIFEPAFIASSFSCRVGKGNHKGAAVLERTLWKISKNNFQPCFILKCDIRKFFENVDHKILLDILKQKIKDNSAVRILEKIVGSFNPKNNNRGLPIGNLTSQLFANIYLNELDYFIKHQLKIKNYIRYTDDFVIAAPNRNYLKELIPVINSFLKQKLRLELHPQKIFLRGFHQGIDFLGYVIFPHHRLLRTKTRKIIFRNIEKRINEYRKGLITRQRLDQSFQSYLGVFSHANAYKLSQGLKKLLRLECIQSEE